MYCGCSKGDKHILVSTMNHAGLDALNAFVIYNSILNYISLLSAGDPPSQCVVINLLGFSPLTSMSLSRSAQPNGKAT